MNPFRTQRNRLEKEILKYSLLKIDDQIYAKVDSFFVERGFSYIKLSNNQEIAIPPSRNHIYEPAFIGDQLKRGQEFYKNANTDTIQLSKDDKTIVFRLGKIINN